MRISDISDNESPLIITDKEPSATKTRTDATEDVNAVMQKSDRI